MSFEYERIVRETPKAVLLVIEGEEVWMPKSQIVEMEEGEIEVTRWIAEQKGLVESDDG